MKARILWIEGNRAEGPSFIPNLRKKGFLVDVVSTGSEALEYLSSNSPDLIVLYAASLRTSGKRICKSLEEHSRGAPILAIVSPSAAHTNDLSAKVVLTLPFTYRKLLNRITSLLPSQENNLLHAGPIRLDLENRQLRCQGRESKLTPRLTHLLKVLMQHSGEVLVREDLFRQVWNTEYTEDTRTLDVHINWLRQALEEDPRRPHFLKTVRGVGYRLDV